MPITLGNTTITGLAVGGLPSGTVNSTTLADSSVVASKVGYQGAIIGYARSTDHVRRNFGNLYRNATVQTALNVSLAAKNNTSMFVARSFNYANQTNHPRSTLQYSLDNSNWYNFSSGSGAGLGWSGAAIYQYPLGAHFYGNGSDPNTAIPAHCYGVYQPSTPHSVSTLYVRLLSWVENSTSDFIANGTLTNGYEHGSVMCSYVEIMEIKL